MTIFGNEIPTGIDSSIIDRLHNLNIFIKAIPFVYYMVYKVKTANNKNVYTPSRGLVEYLQDLSQLVLKQAGKRSAADSRASIRRSRIKNHHLNKYVFPSMANVVVFLEYASRKELRRIFDKDVKELLLGKSTSEYEKHYRPIFRRLIHAALSQTVDRKEDHTSNKFLQEDYEELKSDDFKYLLAQMAQQEIGWMMLGVSLARFGSGGIAQSLMKPDMGRAESWLNLLASGVKSESELFDPNNRPVLF